MRGREKRRTERGAQGAGIVAWMLLLTTLATAFFYGVVGKDKFPLLAPALLTIWALLAFGMTRDAIFRRSIFVAPPGFWPFLIFLAYGAVAGGSAALAFDAKFRLLSLGAVVGCYFWWSRSFALFRTSRLVLGVVIFFALCASFYGLVNFFRQPGQVLWTERYAPYVGRLASVYICPNHFAHFLQMLLPFCLLLVFVPAAGLFLRILSGYAFVSFLPVLFLTESRAGWLGSIAAVGAAVCLAALRRSGKLFLLLVVSVPLLSGGLLFGAWHGSETFRRRMEPVVEFFSEIGEKGFDNAEISDFRPQTWLDTIDMIKDKPLFGHGPGSYRYRYPEFRKRYRGVRVVTGHPHNEYLELMAEYGLVGFGLFALAWGWGLIRLLIFALKTPNAHHAAMAIAFLGTAAGTMVHSFVDFEMHVFPNAMTFALLAGVAFGPLCARRRERLEERASPGRRRLLSLLRSALALGIVAGTILAVRPLASAFSGAWGDRLIAGGAEERGLESLNRAIRLDGSNWRACKSAGRLWFDRRYHSLDPKEKRGFAEIERDFMARGYAKNPYDPALASGYGRSLIFLGDRDKGLDLLREAARLRPFNDVYWWRLGVELREAGRYEESLRVFETARKLKNTLSVRANIRWLKNRLGESK